MTEEVTGADLAEHHYQLTEKSLEFKTQNIIKVLGTESEHGEKEFLKTNPTKEEICEYFEQFGDNDIPPRDVGPDLHKAAVAWAEENC